jgi:hypothetical protein
MGAFGSWPSWSRVCLSPREVQPQSPWDIPCWEVLPTSLESIGISA